ncbi:Myb family transcription factor [Heracleum sosnowskyi]|uniref:Myb family transcription factor n=1 Tax=Heracleum sosnowskyi TaxID=360622 RepID=A0AAD8J9B4_9APIA|nr:Myb family transcription factor [Heracleum sosnowskyi]
MSSSRSGSAGKERLKWTQELHNLFEKTVNELGGPDRVTPKGILNAMRIPGLTIYHVKSHLQNYRMSKFVPETPNKHKFERNKSHILPNFSATAGAQLHEALQMQLGVNRRLSDQIEVQRNLKVKVEAQGRFLERIAEEYKSKSNIRMKPSKPFSPISFPYRLKELESEIKESESDSDIENFSIRSDEKLEGSKRFHVDQKDAVLPRCRNFAPRSCAQPHIFVPGG